MLTGPDFKEPLFNCDIQCNASYHAMNLSIHGEKVCCQDCWENLDHSETKGIHWSDLPPFIPSVIKKQVELAKALDKLNQVDSKDEISLDQSAVWTFAGAMAAAMLAGESAGKSGWKNANVRLLSDLFVSQLLKGDLVDAANYLMMIHQRGEKLHLAALKPVAAAVVIDFEAFLSSFPVTATGWLHERSCVVLESLGPRGNDL